MPSSGILPRLFLALSLNIPWRYYYEKASLARQRGDWAEVKRLGDEARTKDVFYTCHLIEWAPFIQAYAIFGDFENLEQISNWFQGSYLDEDECKSLMHPKIEAETQQKLISLFCQHAPEMSPNLNSRFGWV